MDILEQIYYGEIHPAEETYREGSKQPLLLNKLIEVDEELNEGITETAKELFRNYRRISLELQSEAVMESFIDGFRLGAKVLMAVMEK